jgi:hypothetical protein
MYTLHYDEPHRRIEYYLSCDRLALNIAEWARPPRRGADGDLKDCTLWAAAGRLEWALASELTIDGDSVVASLASLSAADLEAARISFRRLIAAVAAECPGLRHEPHSTLAQLVAFGREAVMTGLESPDFFGFLKNELQDVDLAAALRV